MKEQACIDAEGIARLVPFTELDEAACTELACYASLRREVRGACLFERDSDDDWNCYLLEGELELLAEDGQRRVLSAGKEQARYVISRLRPHKFAVTALTDVLCLQLPVAQVEKVLAGWASDSYQVEEVVLSID